MENLNKLGNKLLDYLDKAEFLVNEHLPDFAKQFIDYSIWHDQIWLNVSVFFLCLGVVLFMFVFLMIALKNKPFNEDFGVFGVLLWFIIAVCIPSAFTWNGYTNLKKAEIAPKVYFMDKVKSKYMKKD